MRIRRVGFLARQERFARIAPDMRDRPRAGLPLSQDDIRRQQRARIYRVFAKAIRRGLPDWPLAIRGPREAWPRFVCCEFPIRRSTLAGRRRCSGRNLGLFGVESARAAGPGGDRERDQRRRRRGRGVLFDAHARPSSQPASRSPQRLTGHRLGFGRRPARPRLGNIFRHSQRWRSIDAAAAERLSGEARRVLPYRRFEKVADRPVEARTSGPKRLRVDNSRSRPFPPPQWLERRP